MRPFRFLFTFVPCLLAACAAPSDDVDSESSDLRNCPRTNPDCNDPPTNCGNAKGTVTAPDHINLGDSVSVSWTANVPAECGSLTLSSKPVTGASGTMPPMTLNSSWNFVLMLNGSKVLAQKWVTVDYPSVVPIDDSSVASRIEFLEVVQTPVDLTKMAQRTIVLGPNVDLDLSGYDGVYLAPNVSITGTRSAQSLGPRVHTDTRPKALFKMSCGGTDPNARANNLLSGFRFQGPDFDTMDGDDKLEVGVDIDSCLGVEIANMEISGWSGQAIYIEDAQGRQSTPDAVYIHDSFIHHNQHSGKNGYGVAVSGGAWAKVEHNVFDFNRHAIEANGNPGTGYTANENLVLAGGGHHDGYFSEYTHLFDVHGDANCPDIWPFDSTWECGNAGDKFVYTNNAFQYRNAEAIKIRGVPIVGDFFSGNVFTQGSADDAIGRTEGDTNITIGANTYGVDTFGEYGVCDINGDGKDDLFLATGASFWFKSAGAMEWTFLQSGNERLSDLRLGDFDGDHKCDLLSYHGNQFVMSSGGSGPWTVVPGFTYDITMDQLAVGDFDGDKVMDVFRRDRNGQWSAMSPNRWGWSALQSSGTPLAQLRFGDFNGDGITDVLGSNEGEWAISWGGRTAWQQSGTGINDDLSRVRIGNIDGVPGDDVVRYVATSFTDGHWEASSGARSGWSTFASYSWPTNQLEPDVRLRQPASFTSTFLGRFSGGTTADLLAVDIYRDGHLSTLASRPLSTWGYYSY